MSTPLQTGDVRIEFLGFSKIGIAAIASLSLNSLIQTQQAGSLLIVFPGDLQAVFSVSTSLCLALVAERGLNGRLKFRPKQSR